MSAFPVFFLGKTVFAIRECAVGHVHAVVTNFFSIGNLVVVHSHLPVPVGAVHGLYCFFVQFETPVQTVREGARGVLVFTIPFNRYSHSIVIGLLRGETLSELALCFTPHHGSCPCKYGKVGVSCAI